MPCLAATMHRATMQRVHCLRGCERTRAGRSRAVRIGLRAPVSSLQPSMRLSMLMYEGSASSVTMSPTSTTRYSTGRSLHSSRNAWMRSIKSSCVGSGQEVLRLPRLACRQQQRLDVVVRPALHALHVAKFITGLLIDALCLIRRRGCVHALTVAQHCASKRNAATDLVTVLMCSLSLTRCVHWPRRLLHYASEVVAVL